MKIDPNFLTVEHPHRPQIDNPFGYTDGKISERNARELERREFDQLRGDMPAMFNRRRSYEDLTQNPRFKLFDDFQRQRGRYEGSCDWSLLDEWVAGKQLNWWRQPIGSCVASNSFRPWVQAMMFQIAILQEPEEYLGRNEGGPQNYAPYVPWSYGMARRRANMRRGDGLYCRPMVESYMKDGVLMCHTPDLLSLLGNLGADGPSDFPECRSKSLYRDFGAWQYLDRFTQYADFPVTKCLMIESAEELWDSIGRGGMAFVCSMEAIHKVGEHKDGFPIHARNPRDQWPHNMGIMGRFVASDGLRLFRWGNKSWGPNEMYNREFDEVARSFQQGRLTVASIEEISGPSSSPPLLR